MDYKATQSDITQIANAIREKTETSDLLEFPDDFVGAIRSIETKGTLQMSRIYIGSATVYGNPYEIYAWGFGFRRSKDDPSPVTLADLVGDKIIYRFEMESEDNTISPFILGLSAGVDVMSHPELYDQMYSTSVYYSCNKDMTKEGAGTPCNFYAICLSIE